MTDSDWYLKFTQVGSWSYDVVFLLLLKFDLDCEC